MSQAISSNNPGILAESAAVRVSIAEPRARFSLRARGDLGALEGALGFSLPGKIGIRSAAGGREALRLGPDEWVLVAPAAEGAEIAAACAAVYGDHPHSLVDISGREITFEIDGPRAEVLLTLGCPRDIASIPAGEGRRTVFDGASAVIWRDDTTRFRLDCWNSFAPHLGALLETGCRELAAEPV